MGVRRLRHFQLRCDGNVLYTDSWGEKILTRCEGETVQTAFDYADLMAYLRNDNAGGWRWQQKGGEVRCPRRDHVESTKGL